MSKIRINVNLYPKDGYRFREKDGSWQVSNNSWVEVIAKVQAYRKRKGMPIGDVETEVLAYACNRNPGFCSQANPVADRQRAVVSLKGRVLQWINGWRRKADKKEAIAFVEPQEQDQRAAVCAKCPQNTGLPEGCASCRAALQALRTAVIGRRKVDGRLNGCLLTGEDLPTSVWLDQQRLELPEAPADCWRKRNL